MSTFLKNNNSKKFLSAEEFLSDSRTVCIKRKDGRVTEHQNITQPWRYIKSVIKNIDVIDAWIK